MRCCLRRPGGVGRHTRNGPAQLSAWSTGTGPLKMQLRSRYSVKRQRGHAEQSASTSLFISFVETRFSTLTSCILQLLQLSHFRQLLRLDGLWPASHFTTFSTSPTSRTSQTSQTSYTSQTLPALAKRVLPTDTQTGIYSGHSPFVIALFTYDLPFDLP